VQLLHLCGLPFGIRFCYERDNYYTTYWNWAIISVAFPFRYCTRKNESLSIYRPVIKLGSPVSAQRSIFICNEKDLQLGTEYFFPEIGVRLWRERAFHPKLLKDPLYMEEMQAVLEDEYQYQYFQMVTIID